MASRKARDTSAQDEFDSAVGYYRERLNEPARLPDLGYNAEGNLRLPVRLGPTWETTAAGYWLLPEASLGWSVLGWCSTHLQDPSDSSKSFVFTDEQARWVLWWYSLDERGRFLYRDSVLQRLKGWGKDPLGATLCATELLGPCRFLEWGSDGQPVATTVESAWVQTAAVSQTQTQNTMRLFPVLFSPATIDQYGLQITAQKIHGLNGAVQMEAVTQSPASLEGARATFVLLNETQHWTSSNAGLEMAAVIARNAAKSPDGAARSLRITNAYRPGADSVAEHDRDQYQAVLAGRAMNVGLLYDSLEAPADAKLDPDDVPKVIKAVRGDSVWLDVDRIGQEIFDLRNPESDSRRFWFNQVTTTKDAWISPQEWDECKTSGSLEANDQIALFLDLSKSDDASALVGCRISDGFSFELAVWQRPKGAENWTVDRDQVSDAVAFAFTTYEVLAFFADPGSGHDETGAVFWSAKLDDWDRIYGPQLTIKASRESAVKFDLRARTRQEQFTAAVERTLQDVLDKTLTHDGSPNLRTHVLNARRRPNQWGTTIGKEHRESNRKIDAAISLCGARMARRLVLSSDAYLKLTNKTPKRPNQFGLFNAGQFRQTA